MELLSKFQEVKQHIELLLNDETGKHLVVKKLTEFESLLQKKQNVYGSDSDGYKKLFDNAGDYIFLLTHDGFILSVNSATCEKYGYTHNEFIGKSILDIDASQNLDSISINIDELLQTGSTRFESVHTDRNGNTFAVDIIAQQIIWNNKPAYLHVCRDISRQKALQKALNDSEIQMKKIIDQISDGIIIYEQSGKIVIWNSGVEKMTGMKRENALGRFLYDVQYEILHGMHKDKSLIRKMFDEVVNMTNPGILNTLFENEIIVEGRGVRTLQAIVFPIELEEGKRLFGSVMRDITEIKRYQNQLSELIATKDKIFSVIAHDLRTPFTSIIGFTDLLLDNYNKFDEARIRKILEYINLSAKPTLDVLTNLLNWVNVQTGQLTFNPEIFSLKELVREVIEIMTPAASIKNIDLVYDKVGEYEVSADINMLKSVLQNLIGNAIKFSWEGGAVEVLARRKADFIEIEVADDGMGMDDQRKTALFSVDSQLSTTGTQGEKGSGLGLILCKEFVERHGGNIRVESEPGNGCSFLFTIPANLR